MKEPFLPETVSSIESFWQERWKKTDCFIDKALLESGLHTIGREEEIEALTNSKVKSLVKEQNITLINYNHLTS